MQDTVLNWRLNVCMHTQPRHMKLNLEISSSVMYDTYICAVTAGMASTVPRDAGRIIIPLMKQRVFLYGHDCGEKDTIIIYMLKCVNI